MRDITAIACSAAWLASVLLASPTIFAQVPASASTDPAVFAVGYVEARADAAGQARAALAAYRDAARKQNASVEIFEQVGRPRESCIARIKRQSRLGADAQLCDDPDQES